ncbi:MAG TPA: extradiol dioxygenase [Candidatus Krumholzibacteria bacterium]
MIIGAHSIIYSKDPEADRAFFRDVLKLPNVDVGGGWLIFALPPAEVAVHPADENNIHEFYLMCEDVKAFVAAMKKRGLKCSGIQDTGWGLFTGLTLPGGGKLGVYEPRHARPAGTARAQAKAKKPARATAKKKTAPAKKKTVSRRK